MTHIRSRATNVADALPGMFRRLRRRVPEMLKFIRRLVQLESPSTEKSAVDRVSRCVASEWRRFGAQVRLLPRAQCGDMVRAEFAARALPERRSQILVLGHLDTVYPLGTLRRMPFRVSRGRAFGPGVYDMKAGIAMAIFAAEALRFARLALAGRVVFLFTTDEETGSEFSRAEIEREARRSRAVLVLEPSLGPRGLLKTTRKGVCEVELRVIGKSAHAGVNPASGVNAAQELALQMVRLAAWSNPARGLTVQPTVISGGTFSNVIPAAASARFDIRFSALQDGRVLERRLRMLKPVLKGARLEVHGGINRPPLERSAGVAALMQQARKIGRVLSLRLQEGATGGGSDGNFTAALGVPTLDGLGAVGEGAHSPNESIFLRVLPERTALLAGLLASL